MQKALAHLREELAAIRTGRASPAIVEKLKVNYYGSETPLQQLAGITVPDPRMLLIAPYDKGALGAIEKAIQTSDLGVNPSNDGVNIRITFPQLTQERRKEMVKGVKARGEETRVGVRNARRQARHDLEALEHSGDMSKDDLERAEKELEALTHDLIAEIDKVIHHKEQELLDV